MNTPTTKTLTFTSRMRLQRREKGRLELRPNMAPVSPPAPAGRVPRISRLMALAIRFDDLLRRDEVKDLADIARLGHVTRARATQIMNLLMLAPDIQEALLFLPAVEAGRDPVREWQLRPIAAEPLWKNQRRLWGKLQSAGLR
jgi:hypothetical protein